MYVCTVNDNSVQTLSQINHFCHIASFPVSKKELSLCRLPIHRRVLHKSNNKLTTICYFTPLWLPTRANVKEWNLLHFKEFNGIDNRKFPNKSEIEYVLPHIQVPVPSVK